MNHTAATGPYTNGGVSRWITTYRYLCLQPARSATAKMDSNDSASYRAGHIPVRSLPCFYVCGLFFVVINGGAKPSRAVPASVRDQRIVRPAFTPSTSPSPRSSLGVHRAESAP